MSHQPYAEDGLSIIVAAVQDRSFHGIADAVERLIREGELDGGQRLATVRRTAEALHVSPATVSAAWTRLRQAGWLHTDRRRGTLVAETSHNIHRPWSGYPLDEHLPDPALLPPLDAAFGAAAGHRYTVDVSSVESSLLEAVSSTWPYAGPAFTVANGGYEGTLLALRATLRPGGVVAVEQPTAPRIMQTLRAVRAVIVPVAGDLDGPLPDAVQEALFRRPDILLFQPRSQVPTGATLSHSRIDELSRILGAAPAPVTVIEDDNIGPASSMPARTLAGLHPHPHVLVRSYCKAFGIDIRTCVISGPHDVIARIERIRSMGMVPASSMLQRALAYLITDDDTQRRLRVGRRRHRDRRAALADALASHGLDLTGAGDGLTLWMPVTNEARTHQILAEHDVTVGSGSACHINPTDQEHIWIGTGSLPDAAQPITELAALLADAATADDDTAVATVS